VVLSHGWSCSTAFWAAQIRDLAADHRVIAYDQRGHGGSPANPVCSADALADDLEAVLAPGERAVLTGYSMGGDVPVEYPGAVAVAIRCFASGA
jgi:pimeloyl-ACP methyl ester carboxylesterase